MAYYYYEAANGENGATGNKAGDQSGNEVRITSPYGMAFNRQLRYHDASVAKKAAIIGKKLAVSNLVGYDQDYRNTLYRALKKYNFDVDAYIASGEKTSADCSSYQYAIWCCLIPTMRSDSNAPTTHAWSSGIRATFLKFGFSDFTGTSYQDGDVLLKEGSHVVGVTTSKSVTSSKTANTTKKTTTSVSYYPAYTGVSSNLDEILSAIGANADYDASASSKWARRTPIANANGIANYAGTAEQNTTLKTLAKSGKLRRVGSADNAAYYVIGKNYTLQANVYVRYGPSINSVKYPYSKLSADAKAHCVTAGTALLKKGTVVTCKSVTYENGNTWLYIPSGAYVAALYNGEVLIK